jgi:hypothetical protein
MFQTYYNGILRKYIILFGTLFNDIYINRKGLTTDQDYVQTIKIPLSYGPKEKFLARVDSDPTFARPTAIVLPRMSFEIVDISYSPDRKLPKINKIVATNADDPTKLNFTYMPVPYDINIELSVMTKNADDGTQIIEQILPYFTPEFTATINVLPDLGVKLDIPIVLNSVNYSDTYEGDFISRRAIIWTMNFTVRGYLFGPTNKNGGKIINLSNTAIYANTVNITTIDPDTLVKVTPGLLANGSPTEEANLSIDKDLIAANSDFGFITDFAGYNE